MEHVTDRRGPTIQAALLERAWIWSVVGYSVLRFVVAWAAFGAHGANAWTFGIIDVATAWPYAKAVAAICRYSASAEWKRLGPAAGTAVATFMAPYVYLWWAAPNMPLEVRSALVFFVAVMAAAIGAGLIRRVRAMKVDSDDRLVVASEDQLVIDLRDKRDVPTPAHADAKSAASENRLVVGLFDDHDIVPARMMQADVYRSRGFVHESQRLDDFGAIVDDWSRQSVHFALYQGDKPIGHARLIAPGPVDIPVRQHFALGAEIPQVWEWSAHATSPDAPRRTHTELARHVVSFLAFNDINEVAMVCEPALTRLVERSSRRTGLSPFLRLGPDQHVWGGINGPMLFDIERTDPAARTYFSSSEAGQIALADALPSLARVLAN